MKTHKFTRLAAYILSIAMLLTLSPTSLAAQEATTIPPDLTAQELVSRMHAGWNLGNTFDAWDQPGRRLTGTVAEIETLWLGGRSNQTTESLIQTVRAAGFDTLRIPVTWSKVADPDNNWEIRPDWMERVQEVVDWALALDMFVILNTHHENAALALDIENANEAGHPGHQFVTHIWRQIAQHFIDYDERLIFASLNEPRHEGGDNEWWGATKTVRDNVNYLNQAFVDVVRATGGNNRYRILQVPTVAAGATPNGMGDFVVPTDPINEGVNKIVWSVHTYSPFNWAHDGRGTYGGPGQIAGDLDNVLNNAQRLGLPVILGEWGSIHASVGDGADQALRNIQRAQHAEDYTREARERGMVAVWWDNGGFTGTDHTFGIIRRSAGHAIADEHQAIINGIMLGAGRDEYVREIEVEATIDEPIDGLTDTPTEYDPATPTVEEMSTTDEASQEDGAPLTGDGPAANDPLEAGRGRRVSPWVFILLGMLVVGAVCLLVMVRKGRAK